MYTYLSRAGVVNDCTFPFSKHSYPFEFLALLLPGSMAWKLPGPGAVLCVGHYGDSEIQATSQDSFVWINESVPASVSPRVM